ncbi:putative quinol monooxygenase (plasmid) [Streptosporangium sp. CA-135522]|uniref:putative quinol monooxygenase n=1 Tax=Streptosporangium sp. CA-135522 TaxID=3240072 RepID=UPI003D913CDB
MSNTLTIMAGFVAKPGQEQRLRDKLDAMIAPSLAEEGCLSYQPYADPNRSDRMIIVEEWIDCAALDHHFSLPHFKHVAQVLDEILTVSSPCQAIGPVPCSTAESRDLSWASVRSSVVSALFQPSTMRA